MTTIEVLATFHWYDYVIVLWERIMGLTIAAFIIALAWHAAPKPGEAK
jgi:hypothetical protein